MIAAGQPCCLLRAVSTGPATDRKQGGAALRTVALPACPTVRQGYLLRVGNRDLRSADAPTLGAGILRRWIRVGHSTSIIAAERLDTRHKKRATPRAPHRSFGKRAPTNGEC